MSDLPLIRPVTAEEQPRAIAAIAEAFSAYPIYHYLFGKDCKTLPQKIKTFIEVSVKSYPQCVYTDGCGVWLVYVRKGDKAVFPGVGAVLRAIGATGVGALGRAIRFFKVAMRAEREAKPQGDHLLLLAADREHRGKGYASKVLDALRAQGAFYLETHRPTNVAIYLHKGGRLLSATPIGKNLTHNLIAFEKAAPAGERGTPENKTSVSPSETSDTGI